MCVLPVLWSTRCPVVRRPCSPVWDTCLSKKIQKGSTVWCWIFSRAAPEAVTHLKPGMGNYLKSLLATIDREAWQRFFLAVGGLSLAFAAAVFSSVAREKGNLLATAALATSALLLSLVVQVITVPSPPRPPPTTRRPS